MQVSTHTRDRPHPGAGQRFIHQVAARPLADRPGRQAEEGDLAARRLAEVKLKQADIASRIGEHISVDPGIGEDGGKLRFVHDQARVPHPVRAYRQVELPIGRDIAARQRPQHKSGRGNGGLQRRARCHLQRSHHICKRRRRQVIMALGQE